jgi:ferredoxin
MIQVDSDTKKATKCNLCQECVGACPTGALQFVPWKDHTKDTPPRQSAMKITAQDATANCAPCHVKQ